MGTFTPIGTYDLHPTDYIHIWASLSLYPLESCGQAAYTKNHSYPIIWTHSLLDNKYDDGQ